MVIYSDKTGLKYDTVEACVKAEKEYDEKELRFIEKSKFNAYVE